MYLTFASSNRTHYILESIYCRESVYPKYLYSCLLRSSLLLNKDIIHVFLISSNCVVTQNILGTLGGVRNHNQQLLRMLALPCLAYEGVNTLPYSVFASCSISICLRMYRMKRRALS